MHPAWVTAQKLAHLTSLSRLEERSRCRILEAFPRGQFGVVSQHVSGDVPADLSNYTQLAQFLHLLLVINELLHIVSVAGRPHFQAGRKVAGGERSPLRILVNRHNLNFVAEFVLKQDLGDIDICSGS